MEIKSAHITRGTTRDGVTLDVKPCRQQRGKEMPRGRGMAEPCVQACRRTRPAMPRHRRSRSETEGKCTVDAHHEQIAQHSGRGECAAWNRKQPGSIPTFAAAAIDVFEDCLTNQAKLRAQGWSADTRDHRTP